METGFYQREFLIKLSESEIKQINLETVKIGKITFTPGMWFTSLKSTKRRRLTFEYPMCFHGRFRTPEKGDLLLIAPYILKPNRWMIGFYNILNQKLFIMSNPGQGFDIFPTSIGIVENQKFEKYPEEYEQITFLN
jgi:hypothetical protein